MSNHKNNQPKNQLKMIKAISLFFIFIINIIGCVLIIFKPKSWNKFLKKEQKEINELSDGKEDVGKFCHDSWKIIKDAFIPYDGNDNRPKALRPKTLTTYVIIAIMVKIFVTGFLFIAYPDPAQLAAIVSSRMVDLINISRKENGIEALKTNEILAMSAQLKGQDMINRQYFAHDTPDGRKPWQFIDRNNFDYIYAGENLAMDFTSAEVVHSAFMKSPSHQRNILNPKYKEVGIAVINGKMNNKNTILLVEFFGTKRGDSSTLASATTNPTVATKPSVASTPTVPTTIKPTVPVQAVEPNPIQNAENDSDKIPAAEPTVPNSQPVQAEVMGEEISLEDLNNSNLSQGIIVVTSDQKASQTIIDLVIEYSNIFFIAFVIFIFISLLLNIFIRIKIQHSAMILQTVAVLALIISMVLVKFNFAETISPQLLIL